MTVVVGALVAASVLTALVLAIAGAVLAGLGRPPGAVLLGLSVLVEVLLVVQTVAAVVALVGGDRPSSMVTFLAYLVGVLVVLPLCVMWSLAEPTRWSNLVVAVGALTVMAMVARLDQIWRLGAG